MRIAKFIEASPALAILSIAKEISQAMNTQLVAFDLNMLQALVLVAIFFEEDKRARPGDLARAFATSKGNISHITSSLEAKKLLRRSLSHRDHRINLLELTRTGDALCLKLISYFDKTQSVLEDQISDKKLSDLKSTLDQVRTLYVAHS